MAFNMFLWEIQGDQLVELPKRRLDEEERLREWIAQDVSLLGLDLLIIGRQVQTRYGGWIDLLAIDQQGDLVILELKRHQTPREVVAQVLDYASWVAELTPQEVADIAQAYLEKPLSAAFQERWEADLPEVINNDHRMIIVASELDDSSERIVQYLATRHSLNINVVFFTCFQQDGKELIGRAWLLDPEEVEDRTERRLKAPWDGLWFVNVGESDWRNWDDCVKYCFLSAGGGRKYTEPLRKLIKGSKVFAYMKKLGYVGYGEVETEAQPAKDFVPPGQKKSVLDLPLVQQGMKHDRDDPEQCEWVIGVKWLYKFPREEAKWFDGAFANQNIVCKLRDRKAVEYLRREFNVTD
jgi:hypothetical protein